MPIFILKNKTGRAGQLHCSYAKCPRVTNTTSSVKGLNVWKRDVMHNPSEVCQYQTNEAVAVAFKV